MRDRYVELDSLRGLAALFVVIGHHLMIFPLYADYISELNFPFSVYVLKESPLRLIFSSGNESVILFFVLSGFVLSLPYHQNSALGYKDYLVRRMCRIYMPYLVSIIIAITCKALLSREGVTGVSDWFNKSWSDEGTVQLLLHHITLIGTYNTDAYNNAIWSLVHEMRISIVFPFLMLIFIRLKKRSSFIAICVLIIVSSISLVLYKELRGLTSYGLTFHYVTIFLIGALLASYREKLIHYYRSLRFCSKCFVFLVALLLYLYDGIFSNYQQLDNLICRDFSVTLGGCIFIIMSIASPRASVVLKTSALTFLGKISYSLYLYHLIVLFSLVHSLYGMLRIEAILLLSFAASICIAFVMYRFIEKPSYKLGKYITEHRVEKIEQMRKWVAHYAIK